MIHFLCMLPAWLPAQKVLGCDACIISIPTVPLHWLSWRQRWGHSSIALVVLEAEMGTLFHCTGCLGGKDGDSVPLHSLSWRQRWGPDCIPYCALPSMACLGTPCNWQCCLSIWVGNCLGNMPFIDEWTLHHFPAFFQQQANFSTTK